MFSASPAVVGDRLYLRGERYLYCIGEEQPAAAGEQRDQTEGLPAVRSDGSRTFRPR